MMSMADKDKVSGGQTSQDKVCGGQLSQQGRALGGQASQQGRALGGQASQQGRALAGQASQQGRALGGQASQQGRALGGQASQQGRALGGQASQQGRALGGQASQQGRALAGQASQQGRALGGQPSQDRTTSRLPVSQNEEASRRNPRMGAGPAGPAASGGATQDGGKGPGARPTRLNLGVRSVNREGIRRTSGLPRPNAAPNTAPSTGPALVPPRAKVPGGSPNKGVIKESCNSIQPVSPRGKAEGVQELKGSTTSRLPGAVRVRPDPKVGTKSTLTGPDRKGLAKTVATPASTKPDVSSVRMRTRSSVSSGSNLEPVKVNSKIPSGAGCGTGIGIKRRSRLSSSGSTVSQDGRCNSRSGSKPTSPDSECKKNLKTSVKKPCKSPTSPTDQRNISSRSVHSSASKPVNKLASPGEKKPTTKSGANEKSKDASPGYVSRNTRLTPTDSAANMSLTRRSSTKSSLGETSQNTSPDDMPQSSSASVCESDISFPSPIELKENVVLEWDTDSYASISVGASPDDFLDKESDWNTDSCLTLRSDSGWYTDSCFSPGSPKDRLVDFKDYATRSSLESSSDSHTGLFLRLNSTSSVDSKRSSRVSVDSWKLPPSPEDEHGVMRVDKDHLAMVRYPLPHMI